MRHFRGVVGLVAAFLLVIAVVAFGQDVIVGIYNNPPLTVMTENGTAEGFMVELLEAVADDEGWILTYVPCAWPHCIDFLASGDINLLGAIAETEERGQSLDFTREAAVINWGQLVTAPETAIGNIGDLDGMSVALLPGDTHAIAFGKEAAKWGVTCEYIEVLDYTTVLQMVERREADVGVVNRVFADGYGKAVDINLTAVQFNPVLIRYATPKGVGRGLLEAIDRHLALWKADENSIYYTSFARWLGEDGKVFLPAWAIWGLVAFGSLAVLLGSALVVLQWLVTVRTRELVKSKMETEQALVEIQQAHEIGNLGRWEVNHQQREAKWSTRAGELFGFDESKCQPTYETFLEAVHPADRERVNKALTQSVESFESSDIIFRLSSKDETERYVRQICRTDCDTSGAPGCTVGIVQDITRQMLQAKEIKESENRFRLLYDNAPIACMTVDPNGVIIAMNEACEEECNTTIETCVGREFLSFVTEASVIKAITWFEKVKTSHEVQVADLTVVRGDGTEFVASVTGRSSFTVSETPGPCHVVIHNVTEQRRMEARIVHINSIFQALFSINKLMIRAEDLNFFFQEACNLLVSHRGYDNVWIVLLDATKDVVMWGVGGDFAGRFPDFLEQIHSGALPNCIVKAIATNAPIWVSDPVKQCPDCCLSLQYEGRVGLTEAICLPNSMYLLVGASLSPEFSNDSKEESLFGQIAKDISYTTCSLLQGKALRESEELYGHLFRNSIDAILLADSDGVIREANRAAHQMFGYLSGEMHGMPIVSLHKNEGVALSEMKEVYENGSALLHDAVLVRKDGNPRICQRAMCPVRDEDEKIIGFEGIIRDVTEQRHAEKKLQQRLKNTIATLAHITELRDPYTAGHQARVAKLSLVIAQELGWTKKRIHQLVIAAQLHDIGKIVIPGELLSKPSKLMEAEILLIHMHPEVGSKLLQEIDFEGPVQEIILQHHERLDGSGYPRGLQGSQILDEAKVIAVSDVVDAMSSHRPYRPGWGIDITLKEIENRKTVLYEESVVDICLGLFREKGFRFSKELQRNKSGANR